MAGALASDPAVAEEIQECEDEPEQDPGPKSGWPELQKDAAPSALLVPAQRCMQKHMKKLEDLTKRYTDAAPNKRSDLQTK